MFGSCYGLTYLPANLLPAENLAESCYDGMFCVCKGLTEVPADLLPATTLAAKCYEYMFKGCTALTAAPELNAATLVDRCYVEMFNGCTSLSSITCMALDLGLSNNTSDWIKGVASTGTFTKKDIDFWSERTGYDGIPSGWNVVNK
jgi:hypothetical protein